MEAAGPATARDHESEVRSLLGSVLDSLFTFAAVLSPDGTVVDTNAAALEAGGLSLADVVGRRFWECAWWSYDPALQEEVAAAVASARSGDVVRRAAQVRVAGDGRMWVDYQIAPLVGPDGAVSYLIACGSDIDARRSAELAVVESEARLRSVFEGVDEGFCQCEIVLDADGHPADYRFLEVNRLFATMTGLHDAVGRTALELVPDLERFWIDTYGRVALHRERIRFEQRSEAMGRWFDVFAMPVEPAGRFALVFKDVTAARRTQEALGAAARRDRFRASLTDTLRDQTDPAALQAAAARLTAEHLGMVGVDYVDVVEHGALALVPGRDGATRRQVLRGEVDEYGPALLDEARSGRTVVVTDVSSDPRLGDEHRAATIALGVHAYVLAPIRAADVLRGVFVVHAAHPRSWTDDEVALIGEAAARTGAALARVRAQLELRESEERFRNMADGLPLPVWVHGPDGAQTWVNLTFCEFFGVSRDEMLGARWRLFTHPDDGSYAEQFAASVRERREFEAEVRVRVADGDWRHMHSWANPRFSPSGEYLGHIGTSADVTERKHAEAIERRSRVQAELLAELAAELEREPRWRRRCERLLELLVPRLADEASIEVPGEGEVAHVRGHHDPVVPTVSDVAAAGRSGTAVSIPIDLGGGRRGELVVHNIDPARPPISREELEFLATVAAHAGVIIASAAVREEQQSISLRLQQALLPQHVAQADGVGVAARYVAPTAALDVGGDWYDSILLPDGRLLLVVGDVVGHGVEAAAMMGRLRAGLAALAVQEQRPARLLELLDAYASGSAAADVTTVCCMVLDPSTGELHHASAGHPPALVVAATGESRWLDDGRSAPLCVRSDLARPESCTTIEPGSRIVMCTDGLFERRGVTIDDGLERLRSVAVAHRSDDPAAICDALIAMSGESSTSDDQVVLCVAYVGAGDG